MREMLEFDRFMLARTEKLKAEVRRAYEEFDFQTVYHAVLNFAVIDLSSLFIDVARDRLYCSRRQFARASLGADRALQCPRRAGPHPRGADPVHRRRGLLAYAGREARERASADACAAASRVGRRQLLARWERLLDVRGEALKLLEAMRQAGTIGAPLEADTSHNRGDKRTSDSRR